MNQSNRGANNNTLQILLDVFIIALAYLFSIIIFNKSLDHGSFMSFSVLVVVFIVIYTMSNRKEYLYNVTMFYYLDRVHKKLTKSFIVAAVTTSALMAYMPEVRENTKAYFVFLILSYLFIVIKMFFRDPISRYVAKKRVYRTAYVGKIGYFNKFRYFMGKTSISEDFVGYIAMNRDDIGNDPNGEYIGYIDDIETLIREYHIDQVFFMQKKPEDTSECQKYVDLCIEMGITVKMIVDFYKRRRANSYVSSVGTYPVITYHTITLNDGQQVVKRVVDIFGGLVGIIISSPIMLVTAIAIKLDSPGPVLFKQTRVGMNGREFKIFKFRSMYIDAEARKAELMAQNEIEGGVMFKMKDDPRITKVGKVIRKLSIDELPQFFNIVGGTMSLVGTRPPTLDEVEKYKRNQWRRISIKPGLTGMWQVSGRSNIDNFDDIVEMDLEYIDNWSLMLDIKILFKTVMVVLKHEDAC